MRWETDVQCPRASRCISSKPLHGHPLALPKGREGGVGESGRIKETRSPGAQATLTFLTQSSDGCKRRKHGCSSSGGGAWGCAWRQVHSRSDQARATVDLATLLPGQQSPLPPGLDTLPGQQGPLLHRPHSSLVSRARCPPSPCRLGRPLQTHALPRDPVLATRGARDPPPGSPIPAGQPSTRRRLTDTSLLAAKDQVRVMLGHGLVLR